MNAIRVIDIVKRYGDVLALNGISLDIEEGEFFGLLGPNGAGKTTLIRILTGLTAPTSGKALIFGYDIIQEPVEAKRQFGVVPEVSNVYDDLTAWDNLIFTAKLYGIPKSERERRAMELLEAFGLKERLKDPVKQFSKGMKRRLTIATALIHDPRILFLDEPTSGLDVQSTRFIREILRRLNEEEMTIFLATHYIEEADQLCERIAILNRGKICVVDTPESLKTSLQQKEALEVTFNSPPDESIEKEFEKHCDEILKIGEEKFRFYISSPFSIMHVLLRLAENKEYKGLKILSIRTIKPTLEDVFIKYTGIDPLMAERMEQLRHRRG